MKVGMAANTITRLESVMILWFFSLSSEGNWGALLVVHTTGQEHGQSRPIAALSFSFWPKHCLDHKTIAIMTSAPPLVLVASRN